MTGAEALGAASRCLDAAGIDGAPSDARRLLAWSLGATTDRLALALPEVLTGDTARRFEGATALRCKRVPVSQITGQRMFYGRVFHLDREVLDPRPETEILIEQALEDVYERVLDLGSGTGCIAVTLLAERPDAIGTASDVSVAARQHTLANAMMHGVSDRLEVLGADWFTPLEGEAPITGRFDLIVSNPPYIAAHEMDDLAPEVRDWEPRQALTDEGDGLDAYRAIAADAPRFLVPGGRLLVEIG
ncbi:MAG: peptide chain release factor N(5)-glutamine methyltransferase, partial [Rhodobacteraceae bacterium]